MELDEIMDGLRHTLEADEDVESVGKIDDQKNVLGVEMKDGTEFFVTVDMA